MVSKNINSHFLCGVFSNNKRKIIPNVKNAVIGRHIWSGLVAKYKPNNNWSKRTFTNVQQAPALLASQTLLSFPEMFALKIAQSKNGGKKRNKLSRKIK